MNMAEYTTVVVVGSQRPEQPKNVNIWTTYKRNYSDIFDWD